MKIFLIIASLLAAVYSFVPSSQEGELEVVIECNDTYTRTIHYLKTKEGRKEIKVKGRDELKTGQKVRVTGEEVEILSDVQADATNISVLVFLVNFQNDLRTPYTTAQAEALMNGQVKSYYEEASYGQATVTASAVGVYTLPMDADCNNYSQMATLARSAATNAGVNISAYQKHMFVFPGLVCGWSGLGYLGGKDLFVNNSLILRTTAHELGHTLGLYHSQAVRCEAACTSVEYGHTSDIMGQAGVTGHFHPYQKERLGWIAVPEVGSGTYEIFPLSVNDGNTKAIKIPRSQGGYYYVEFRRPVGFDSFVASNPYTMNGVLVTRNSSGSSNYLYDMTPSTAYWSDAALQVGETFSDEITISVISVSDGGAVVQISRPTTTPTPTPSPTQPTPTPVCTKYNPKGKCVAYAGN